MKGRAFLYYCYLSLLFLGALGTNAFSQEEEPELDSVVFINISFLEFPVFVTFKDNPACAGLQEKAKLYLDHNSKFYSFPFANSNSFVAYDFGILKDQQNKMGIGFFANVNRLGNHVISTINFTPSVKVKISEYSRLSFGISIISFNHIYTSEDNNENMYQSFDPSNTYEEHSYYFLFNKGFWFSRKKFFTGISFLGSGNSAIVLNELIGISYLDDIPPAFQKETKFYCGREFEYNDNLIIIPTLEYNHYSSNISSLLNFSPSAFGIYKDKYLLGISYNNLKSFELTGGIQINDQFQFYFSGGSFASMNHYKMGQLLEISTGLKYYLNSNENK